MAEQEEHRTTTHPPPDRVAPAREETARRLPQGLPAAGPGRRRRRLLRHLPRPPLIELRPVDRTWRTAALGFSIGFSIWTATVSDGSIGTAAVSHDSHRRRRRPSRRAARGQPHRKKGHGVRQWRRKAKAVLLPMVVRGGPQRRAVSPQPRRQWKHARRGQHLRPRMQWETGGKGSIFSHKASRKHTPKALWPKARSAAAS